MSRRILITFLIIVIIAVVVNLADLTSTARAHHVNNCSKWVTKQIGENYAKKRSPLVKRCRAHKATYRLISRWKRVAKCESGLRWGYNGAFDGGLQFHPSTWTSTVRGTRYRDYAYAYQAPKRVQIWAAERWRKKIGGNPHSTAGWPHCGRYWYKA